MAQDVTAVKSCGYDFFMGITEWNVQQYFSFIESQVTFCD